MTKHKVIRVENFYNDNSNQPTLDVLNSHLNEGWLVVEITKINSPDYGESAFYLIARYED